jgi:SNF2 family DNA or RNA helicase
MKIMEDLEKDFISSTQEGTIVVSNVLVKMLRCQQVASGFCFVQEGPMEEGEISELNTAKADALADILEDIGPAPVVVFCVFKHDLDVIQATAERLGRKTFELSGRRNELSEWQKRGGVLAVQIQAGAEGVDMTKANHAIYFSLPHSLALYNQSRARLYRPGQKHPVSFIHIIADKTIDAYMYHALEAKEDIITKIKAGNFNFGYVKH